MTAHARLSASGSERWTRCPGSVNAEKAYPNTSSTFALEGTEAHSIAEKCLLSNKKAREVCKDIEMTGFVQEYVDYVDSVPGSLRMYEKRVDYSAWVPDGFGTSDAIIYDAKSKTLHTIDLKYGKGVKVYAEENTQGLLYCLGAYDLLETMAEIEHVKIHIMQPRLDHIDTWLISVEQLLEKGKWFAERAEEALKPDAKRCPGEKQCQWCKAKADCKELMKYTEEIVGSNFEDLDFKDPNALSLEDVRKILDGKSLIEGWLKAVHEKALDMAHSGDKIPGYKLVEGRSLRAWTDEHEAEQRLVQVLGTKAYITKIISPAQAEKALSKDEKEMLKDIIIKPKGKPSLVPESDKRQEYFSKDEFKVLTD